MGKFNLFNKFNSAVIVINKNGEAVFTNNVFKRVFKDYGNLEKFSHKLNYNVCALVSNDVEVHSPIAQAIKSPEDFLAHVVYQDTENTFFYYDMSATVKSNYNIIVFTDVTAQIKLDSYKKTNSNLSKKIELLEDENSTLQKIKQNAQFQALKLLLLNNVSNIIRESTNTKEIISSTLKELEELFAAFKIYYAQTANTDGFYLVQTTGNENKKENLINFDTETENNINQRKAFCSSCKKEHSEAKTLKDSAQRLIIPIWHRDKKLGIIVILTKQKTKLDDTLEVLDGVSTQLGNAIIQTELYNKNASMVVELTNALNELKDTQLKLINSEKMASLGQLIAGVAHEINTPIASIKSNNEIMRKIINQNTIDENSIAILQDINNIDKEAVDRINRLVISLRKFVRLDEADLQDADINKEIDLTLDLIRHELKNKINVVKNYGEIPKIKCYPNMLNQVFMNILVNAAQSIKTTGTITIDTNYKNSKLFVKIKDTGCGIKEPEKIFFAGYTTKGVGVGTGLGLAISQKIIEKHKGKIDVKSEINKGSEFLITIPS